MKSQIKKTAEAIADDLFKSGFGSKAYKLALVTAEGRDLGGWCKRAVVDRIMKKLEEMPVRGLKK